MKAMSKEPLDVWALGNQVKAAIPNNHWGSNTPCSIKVYYIDASLPPFSFLKINKVFKKSTRRMGGQCNSRNITSALWLVLMVPIGTNL